eukprot:724440_1
MQLSIDNSEHNDLVRFLVGKMIWIKDKGAYYPVLVESMNSKKTTAFIWDGQSTKEVAVTDLYKLGEKHSERKSDIAVKQLLEYTQATQQTLILEREQSKAECKKYQSATKDIVKMIHGKIQPHHKLKWRKQKDGRYQPVLLLQKGNSQCRTYVLDTNNHVLHVKGDSLLDTPPYATEHDIANHVEQLDLLCANYPWKCAIECGATKCSWTTTPGLIMGLFSDGTVTGTIRRIDGHSKSKHCLRYQVQRHDNQKTQLLWDDQNNFQILGPGDKAKQLYMKELQTTNEQLTQQILQLQDKNATYEGINQSLQSKNDRLESSTSKHVKDIALQNKEINELKMRCEEATKSKTDFENQYLSIKTVYNDLKQESDQLKSKFNSMKDRPTANVTTIRNLKKEKNHAIKERDSLKKQKEKLKKQNDQFQSKNDDLESTIRKLKKDMDLQRAKIKELEMECQQAITLKDDYDRLTHESDELKQQNKEQGELINKLRDMLSEYSSALDLTRGFPPVQDIVNDFGTLKSQYYVEAAKQMRKVLLKQRHKEYSKLRHYKCVCEILFDILIKSYAVMKQFVEE